LSGVDIFLFFVVDVNDNRFLIFGDWWRGDWRGDLRFWTGVCWSTSSLPLLFPKRFFISFSNRHCCLCCLSKVAMSSSITPARSQKQGRFLTPGGVPPG